MSVEIRKVFHWREPETRKMTRQGCLWWIVCDLLPHHLMTCRLRGGGDGGLWGHLYYRVVRLCSQFGVREFSA